MIQRYGFFVNSHGEGEMISHEDGDYVLYADHVAALTVDDAMVERAYAAFQDAYYRTGRNDAMRAALTAALGGS